MVETITVERLADRIDADEQFTLVDTRPTDSYEAWHVRGAENVPYDPSEGLDQAQLDEVSSMADGRGVVAICGKGLTSTAFGLELAENDFEDVSVVSGGMEAWSKVYEVVPIPTDDEDLVVRQVQRRAKGCLGYVVGSRSSGTALVVDATRQTDRFKVAAQDAGLVVDGVVDTHVHADHISGGRQLADDLGVEYYLGERATDRGVEYEFTPLADGDVIDVGDVTVEALHAPGHTSEMIALRVGDELLLTGDTLFVDSVGRTELQFGEADATHGAELLYETLQETILELPDDLAVLPGHVSVTSDGHYENGSPGQRISARLGDLHEGLDLLHLDRDAFVDRLTDEAPAKPPNYEDVIAINTGTERTETEHEATELELGPNNCAA